MDCTGYRQHKSTLDFTGHIGKQIALFVRIQSLDQASDATGGKQHSQRSIRRKGYMKDLLCELDVVIGTWGGGPWTLSKIRN
jgi:hypothetical protein